MGKIIFSIRLIFGLAFVVFGLNGFYNFLPPPPEPMPEGAMAFINALVNTGYMMNFVKGTEVACGVLLVFGLWVPLALVVLAPIVLNIFLFHLKLAPTGLPIAAAFLSVEIILLLAYFRSYKPLLSARA